jgi:hypothetical protein
MFRAFADVQTAEMLNLPRPRLEGGKPIVVACPMSDEQHSLQQELVERYERLRSTKVDPRVDNALNITTDGRKLATDARMLAATAPDFPESKINRLVDNVVSIWNRTTATRGTQMIFCDMGVNPTPWGYSPYDEIIRKLVEHGIPREQKELSIAESQLRDYEARLGKPFAHEAYLSELTAFRDQLKAALSGGSSDSDDKSGPNAFGLADKIKALKAANTIEATPWRVREKQSTAEEPVTARIRRQTEAIPAVAQAIGSDTAPGAGTATPSATVENSPGEPPMTFEDLIALERKRKDDGLTRP